MKDFIYVQPHLKKPSLPARDNTYLGYNNSKDNQGSVKEAQGSIPFPHGLQSYTIPPSVGKALQNC